METNKIAIVFPGQGSQRLGMAKDFVEQFAESRQVFENASDCLKMDFFELCFEDEQRLNKTEFMQPAILTAEIAMLKAFEKSFSVKPAFFAGHSMGEYTALTAAGVFSFEDALRLVNGRNALMQNCVEEGKGAMYALILPEILKTDIRSILSEHQVEIANNNSDSQIVIAGIKENVITACQVLQANYAELRAVDLGIGLPFHSSFMKNVEPELLKYIQTFLPSMNLDSASKVLSNLTGEFHSPETVVDNLVKQISGCVQWVKNMKLLSEVSTKIIELGPNKVLSRFFKEAGTEVSSVYSVKAMKRVVL